jgi:hypothetical protein
LHADYLFLFDNLNISEMSNEVAIELAEQKFNLAFDHRMTENNWWHTTALFSRFRAPIMLRGKDDRSAHDLIDQEQHAEKNFEDFLRESWSFNFNGTAIPPDLIDYQNLPDLPQEALKAHLVARLETYHGRMRAPDARDSDDQALRPEMQRFHLESARYLQSMVQSCQVAGYAAAEDARLTRWRAFDLRETGGRPDAVLVLWVHT